MTFALSRCATRHRKTLSRHSVKRFDVQEPRRRHVVHTNRSIPTSLTGSQHRTCCHSLEQQCSRQGYGRHQFYSAPLGPSWPHTLAIPGHWPNGSPSRLISHTACSPWQSYIQARVFSTKKASSQTRDRGRCRCPWCRQRDKGDWSALSIAVRRIGRSPFPTSYHIKPKNHSAV